MTRRLPPAAPHTVPRGSQPEPGRGASSGQPFPLASDIVGRPLIAPRRMAQAANDQGMIDALKRRLDGPAVHTEIGEREPFLSRVGRFCYEAIDWFCAFVLAFAIGAFVVGFALLLLGAIFV